MPSVVSRWHVRVVEVALVGQGHERVDGAGRGLGVQRGVDVPTLVVMVDRRPRRSTVGVGRRGLHLLGGPCRSSGYSHVTGRLASAARRVVPGSSEPSSSALSRRRRSRRGRSANSAASRATSGETSGEGMGAIVGEAAVRRSDRGPPPATARSSPRVLDVQVVGEVDRVADVVGHDVDRARRAAGGERSPRSTTAWCSDSRDDPGVGVVEQAPEARGVRRPVGAERLAARVEHEPSAGVADDGGAARQRDRRRAAWSRAPTAGRRRRRRRPGAAR